MGYCSILRLIYTVQGINTCIDNEKPDHNSTSAIFNIRKRNLAHQALQIIYIIIINVGTKNVYDVRRLL